MNRSGLTLVEILVAIVIIAVAFMALANSQIMNLRVTRDSQLASISTQIANLAIERATKMVLENGFSCGGACTGTFNNLKVRGTDYSATYTITLPAGNTGALRGLALIRVEVEEPYPVSFSQYVSCMDVYPPPSIGAPAPCPGPGS